MAQLILCRSAQADKSTDNSADNSADDAPLNQAKSAVLMQQKSRQSQHNIRAPSPNRFASNEDLRVYFGVYLAVYRQSFKLIVKRNRGLESTLKIEKTVDCRFSNLHSNRSVQCSGNVERQNA